MRMRIRMLRALSAACALVAAAPAAGRQLSALGTAADDSDAAGAPLGSGRQRAVIYRGWRGPPLTNTAARSCSRAGPNVGHRKGESLCETVAQRSMLA